MGAQLAQMGMGVTDVIMAGRYSSVDLAGVSLGGSIMWPVMMLMMGLVQAVTPTVAQLNGAKDYRGIGVVIRQGLRMALGGGLVAAVLMNNAEPFYRLMQVDPEAIEISVPYLRMASFGIPALMCFYCLRFLSDGMGFTRPALFIAVSALLCKIPLNYVLIYGHFGLPEMDGIGCGAAQAIVMWLQLVLILLVVSGRRFRATGWMSRFSLPDWQRIKPLVIIGAPIGASIFAEVGLFSLTTLLLGRFGADVVASHSIAMNINGIMFMLPLALGMGATIRIGYRVGAGEILEARMTAAITIVSTVIFAVAGAILILVSREYMVAIFTTEAAVSELAILLLMFVVFFLTLDATQTTITGCLRCYKDTRVLFPTFPR